MLLGVGLWLFFMAGMLLTLLGSAEKGQSETVDSEDRQDRKLAIWSDLSRLTLYLGIPFGNLLGVLVFWLIHRHKSAFIDWYGRQSQNYQITLLIYGAITPLLRLLVIGLFIYPLLMTLQGY